MHMPLHNFLYQVALEIITVKKGPQTQCKLEWKNYKASKKLYKTIAELSAQSLNL